MLSISTAWNYRPDMNVAAALEEIKSLGLTRIELGYRLRQDQLAQVMDLLKPMGLSVSSAHNFCPLPDDHPSPRHPSNYYRMSSLDEQERKRAVMWTKKCVDTAVKADGKVVVIHAGMIEIPQDPSRDLIALYKDGQNNTPAFADKRTLLIKLREQSKPPFMDALIKSLDEVVDYAQSKNIRIGLETRYYPFEMPNYEEVQILLDRYHKKGMWYWHDTGHAEANHRLGLTDHADFLKTYHNRLAGFHIHGMRVMRDHLAPFDGDFDMGVVLPYINAKTINVVESHHYASFDQIKAAIVQLKQKIAQ